MSRTRAGLRLLVVLPALLAGTVVAAARRSGYLGGLPSAPPVVVTTAPVRVVADTLRRSETVSQLFQRQGVNDVDWGAITAAVRSFDPSRLRAGMVFTFRHRHGDVTPHAVAVRVAYDARLHLQRAGDGRWSASLEPIPWHTEAFVLDGVVHTSVSDAITGAIGDDVLPMESRIALVDALATVYDWTLDFSRDLQDGDRFRVLARRMVSPAGEVRYDRILAARLDVGPQPLYAFRFDDDHGRQEFWDERGRSLRRELLKAPLEYRRISSGFSRRRSHPVLHVSRRHAGIDFAAAYGTPVRAVGNGTVTYASRLGGYGTMIEIRHANGRISRYAHLSGLVNSVFVGARVAQGETIGYVGASGLATAPHLHYELRVNGVAVNPRRQFALGDGQPIAAARRAAYEEELPRLRAVLEPTRLAAAPRTTD